LAEGWVALPNVIVDSKLVQESGLLKDTITLDVPDEQGDFTTVLLRRGAEKLKESSKAWAAYADEQGDAAKVKPLMVLQVPNSPNKDDVGTWLQTIFDTWPDLPPDSVYNVFGEHKTEAFGGFSVPYIAPERVQESDWVRVLLAKDAISTGWDCPRAEVMVSFRAASDQTHITQLLGRMVRTPLARRIPGNERLNSVDCLLPKFNQDTVKAVVEALMSGGDAGDKLPGRRVLINPKEMFPNPDVSQAVWDKLTSLPSAAMPKKQAKPIKRLTALAHELAADGLVPNAGKQAHAHLHGVLDAQRKALGVDIAKARTDVLTVEGKTVRTDVETQAMSFDDFVEAADYAVIEDAYKRAARLISPDLAKTYAEHLADQNTDAEDYEEALIEAHTDVAALGLVETIKARLESEAEALANEWLTAHEAAIKALTDERQDVYRELRELSADPLDVTVAMPKNRLQPTVELREDGIEVPLPRLDLHLLCDEDGKYPDVLNIWEAKVLETEMSRDAALSWYRNPASAKPESLGIVYYEDGQASLLRPDFIFFTHTANGTVQANLVDPHGYHLADALPKLKGLCSYSEQHGNQFDRIEAVADVNGTLRLLNIKDDKVRAAIDSASSAKSLFSGEISEVYE
jgi:type III restriction enzyme